MKNLTFIMLILLVGTSCAKEELSLAEKSAKKLTDGSQKSWKMIKYTSDPAYPFAGDSYSNIFAY